MQDKDLTGALMFYRGLRAAGNSHDCALRRTGARLHHDYGAPYCEYIMRHSQHLWIDIRDKRFGVEFSRVHIAGQPYLDRWILYCGWFCLRLHKFYRGDDVRAPHDHPFWFVTFPFASYMELVYDEDELVVPGDRSHYRFVKAGRFHFRPATFRHIVLGRADGLSKPFLTFVIAHFENKSWGFWPTETTFVPWREWT